MNLSLFCSNIFKIKGSVLLVLKISTMTIVSLINICQYLLWLLFVKCPNCHNSILWFTFVLLCKIGNCTGEEGKLNNQALCINFFLVYLAVEKANPNALRVVKIATLPEVEKHVDMIIEDVKALKMLSKTDINIPEIHKCSKKPPFIVEEFIHGSTLENEKSMDCMQLIDCLIDWINGFFSEPTTSCTTDESDSKRVGSSP